MSSWLEFKIKILNKFYGHVKVALYLYAVLKYISNSKNWKLPFILLVITTAISLPILHCIILILRSYKAIIHLLLKLRFKSDFYALFDGTDTIFAIDENATSRSVITILFLIEFPGCGDDFFAEIHEKISNVFSQKEFQKLQCNRKQFGGYFYYKKNHKKVNNFVNVLNDNGENFISFEELQDWLSELSNAPMPENDEGMWEVYIGKQKLVKKEVFPVIFRFHHCFGDAVALFNLFAKEFATHKSNLKKVTKNKLKLRPVRQENVKRPFIKAFGLVDDLDRSLLCGAKISGNKHLVWFSDDSQKYFNIIKNVKKQFENVTFVDVVLTAFSASLANYAKKKTDLYPKVINALVPMFPSKLDCFNYGEEDNYKFSNKFTIGIVKIPLNLQSECDVNTYESLLKRLYLVSKDHDLLKNRSLDNEFNRWLGRVILSVFPFCLSNMMIKWSEPSLLFSNVPGCDKIEFFQGSKVKEFVVYDPNVATSGISLMVTSYEKRLSFAFTLDKSIIPDKNDAQALCNDLLKYLEILNQ